MELDVTPTLLRDFLGEGVRNLKWLVVGLDSLEEALHESMNLR